ncbi:MAG: energy-coupling factor transporter transmembrane component T [bacterium]
MSPPAGSTLLGRADARPKLLATLAFLTAVSCVPRGAFPRLGMLAGVLVLLLLLDRTVATRTFWIRLVPVLAIALTMAALVMITQEGGRTWHQTDLVGLTIRVSEAGLWAALELLLRTCTAAGALVCLSVRTSGPELLNALAWLRFPRTFLAVLGSVARTLWLVTDEARRMNRARLMRGQSSLRGRLRAVAGIISSLLLRSFDRAERVHRAMVARGFDGAVPRQLPRPRIRLTEVVASVTFTGLCLAVLLVPLP